MNLANLETTIAVYDNREDAEADWFRLEEAAATNELEIADGGLVENQGGEAVIIDRRSHHGWGKGAVVGAVVGILFPPSLLGAAAVGAGGGALVARFTRALGRGTVKDLGEALDSGKMAIIVVSPAAFTNAVVATVKGANTITTVPSATAEEIQAALPA